MAAARPRQIDVVPGAPPWRGNGSEWNLLEDVQMAYTPLICNSVSAIFVPPLFFILPNVCLTDDDTALLLKKCV